MKQAAVVYWSGTGNTEAMAKKIAEGIESAGVKADIFTATDFSAAMTDSYDAIAFGCPSMGAEQLEENEFEPMFESCKPKLNGKRIVLFGSYGWGDGEWMRIWEEAALFATKLPTNKPNAIVKKPVGSWFPESGILGKTEIFFGLFFYVIF